MFRIKKLELHNKWLNYEDGGIRFCGNSNDLIGADLRGADLRGANIDYACWPIWCGGLNVKVDRRIWVQLAYHLCSLDVDDEECKKYRKLYLSTKKEGDKIQKTNNFVSGWYICKSCKLYGKCKLQKNCTKVKAKREKNKVNMFSEYNTKKWAKK